ncbi:MAG TPA: ATPase [Sphingomonadales bacterium]|nr:ATPase [Sphingomonadales bacterium]
MPQLDPSTFAPQLIWLAITFGVLYFIMARFALPKVMDAVEGRKARIAGDLAAAEEMRRQSEELDAATQAKLMEARARAAALLKAERAKIEGRLSERSRAFAAGIAAKLSAAEQSIAAARTRGLAEAERASAEVAAAIVAQLSGKEDRAER